MKRIKAACLLQTVCFQPKDSDPSALNKQQVRKEYEAYKEKMTRFNIRFKILEEETQPDGAIIVKLKKQNNQQPVGDYFAD